MGGWCDLYRRVPLKSKMRQGEEQVYARYHQTKTRVPMDSGDVSVFLEVPCPIMPFPAKREAMTYLTHHREVAGVKMMYLFPQSSGANDAKHATHNKVIRVFYLLFSA